MATTVTSTKPRSRSGFGGGPKSPRPNGNGSHKRNGHSFSPEFYASRYRVGMWVALAAILMMFTALTSAYIVRGSSNDWVPLTMPRVLLLSTALILVSSGTLEAAKRKLKDSAQVAYKRWLLITLVLGLGFLGSQLFAWRQLIGQGIYVSSNPHSSFFYLLSATHGVHLIGGLLALIFLAIRSHALSGNDNGIAVAKRQAAADAVTLYWHFMDVLWIYLFVLLFYWR